MRPVGSEVQIAQLLVESGLLRIDDEGRVWRIARRWGTRWGKGGVKPLDAPKRAESRTDAGYLVVVTSVGGRRGTDLSTPAHRLVWHCLVGPIPDGLCINHKNGIRDDNRPANLEVVTYSENNAHAYRVLGHKRPLAGPNSKLSPSLAAEIRALRADGKPRREVAVAFGVSETTVKNITSNRTWREDRHA